LVRGARTAVYADANAARYSDHHTDTNTHADT
jgi:hypothetical protein